MGTVNGYTAEAMNELRNQTIVNAYIDDITSELKVVQFDGTEITAGFIFAPPSGGAEGNVFVKTSSVDYETGWTDALNVISLLLRAESVSDDAYFQIQVDDEDFPRISFRSDQFSMSSGDRSAFEGSHEDGKTGLGSDSQFYIEGLVHAANLLHIQASRPGTNKLEEEIIGGTPQSAPIVGGTIVVPNGSEFPSTSEGPLGIGRAFIGPPDVTDSFNRANSNTTLGSPWVAQSGSVWGIDDSKAYRVSGGSISRVVRDTNSTRHRITVSTSGTQAHWDGSGIIFSYVDANNFLYVAYDSGIETWIARKVVAGVDTQLFNSGLSSHETTITAEYVDGLVRVKVGDQRFREMAVSVTAGEFVGLMTPNGGPVGATVRWDDFTIEVDYPVTWTSHPAGQLSGVDSPLAVGTIDTTWTVRYEENVPKILTRWSDRDGAPVARIYENGTFELGKEVFLFSQDGLSSVTIGMVSGDPEGEVTATPGSIRFDSNGVIWLKTAETDDTGWSKVFDGSQAIANRYVRKTADHTLELSDFNAFIEMDVAGVNELEVPPHSLVPLPVGTHIPVFQRGAGLTSFVEGAGVDIKSLGGNLDSAGQYAKMYLDKVGNDEWYLSGDIA